jgi:hypothetical protein
MSSRKRRKARRIRLATRAHGAFFRDPGRVALAVAFYARHGGVSRRYGRPLMTWHYFRGLRLSGIPSRVAIDSDRIDPTVVMIRNDVIFRRQR